MLPEEWPRALLRVELRERGYDAVSAPSLEEANVFAAQHAERGPVRLIVADQSVIESATAGQLDELRSALGTAAVLLLVRGDGAPPDGSWAAVVRRPFQVGDVLRAVEKLVPLSVRTYVPIDAP